MFNKTTRESFVIYRTLDGFKPRNRKDQKLLTKHADRIKSSLGTHQGPVQVTVTTTRHIHKTTTDFAFSWLTN